MSVRTYQRMLLLAFSLLYITSKASESEFITVHCKSSFPETMVHLQEVLLENGYHSLRVQRVDVGLRNHGYKSDKYQIVFFSKANEIETLKNIYPMLIPFLPHKITIYSDDNQTVINTISPNVLGRFFQEPEIREIFSRWDDDIRTIMNEVGVCLSLDAL